MLHDNFGLFIIGHTKLKTIKEQGAEEEQEYQVMSSNLNADYHNIVAHKADVVATVIQEREVNDNRVTETNTNLYFRGNGFVEAGCRFKYIDEKIEFNAKNFINAIENAIKLTSEDNVKIDTKQTTNNNVESVQETKETQQDNNVEDIKTKDINHDLFNTIKPLYLEASKEDKDRIKSIIQEYGYTKLDLNAPSEMFIKVLNILQ